MKKLFTLLVLLVAIVTGAKAQTSYYTPTADEVIILNDIYDGNAGTTGYSKHSAVAWAGTSSSNSKTAGDPDNDGAATSNNVPCYNIKGNGKGKNITLTISGVSKIIIYQEKHSSRYPTLRITPEGESTYNSANGNTNVYYNEFELDGKKSYSILMQGNQGAQDIYVYAVKLIKYVAADKPTITAQPKSAEYATDATATALTVAATASAGNLSYQWYSNTSASNEGGTEIAEATSANYTPSTATAGTYYYYVRVTDGNGSTYSDVATITVEDAVAPTISVTPTAPSTYLGVATTLTAEVTGVPNPTVKWYQNTAAATTGGTEVGTGLTYQPDVTTEGEFYYYAVASNSEGTDTSQLITLTVTDPDKYITGNAYYMSVDEVAVAGENVYAADITMTIKDYEGGAANADNSVSGINSNYVAQITGTHNGWGTEFVATKNGTLSVGVIINGGKTFTLTNVTSFDYNGVQDEGNNNTSESAGTNASNTWKPSKKQWTVLTFDVVAGTTYKLSVAGSKMGFYGFNFTPASIDLTINPDAGATTVYSDYALDFSTLTNVKAYIEKGTGDKLSWTQVTSAPAKTGLLVVSSETALTVPTAASSETDVTGNRLKGVATGESKTVTADDNIYIFTLHDGKPGFIKSNTGRSLAVGKAYLDLGEATGAREFFDLFEDDTTTGISSIDNDQLTTDNDAPAYNLAGQKVGKGYKGIVIINGKKVVK